MRTLSTVIKTTLLATALVFSATANASAVSTEDGPSSDEIAELVYSSSDPEATFESLPEDQQKLFAERVNHWTAVEVESTLTEREPTAEEAEAIAQANAADGSAAAAAAAGRCWSQYKYHQWWDFGTNTGDTWMTAHWCSNGSRITSYRLSNQGGAGKVGHSYAGLGGKYSNDVGWEVRQAQVFKFTFLKVTANPCMQLRTGRTGLYSFRDNCNLG